MNIRRKSVILGFPTQESHQSAIQVSPNPKKAKNKKQTKWDCFCLTLAVNHACPLAVFIRGSVSHKV